ncbi:hypothetical protein H5392_09250 [Tessaracoccus sp. MC1865]|uniref:HAAS signaling domain-containing protein n=1 Tax=Tessaracoccus sp. MC1865 TaxID=2760310 RepID=UPI0015FEFF17|nr:hypothetical protein [Tessaracoccus sp. MC1865]MBB1484045.1 hypothetical protein [Tessaracoccus sp. MC1865]QTO37081.1 hypothetical protein J7D54_11620 [Tessaracoccus sp. MC1865]
MNATDYIDDLALELRLLDVPGDRIGEVLAEVESHVAETGEDPVEAFGPVKAYAAERASATGVAVADQSAPFLMRLFRGQVLFALAGFGYTAVAGWFLVSGVLALFSDGTELPFGMPVWASLTLGVVLLAAWGGWFLRLSKKERIIDPRTGAEVQWDAKGRRRRG